MNVSSKQPPLVKMYDRKLKGDMISDNLRVRLGAAIEEHVSQYSRLYEERSSGVNDVKQFFYHVADVFQQRGYSDDVILALYNKHKGNYLLGRKYGVTAGMFAERLLEDGYEMYTVDRRLPVTGYRTKGDNSKVVLFRLRERSACFPDRDEERWEFKMAIDTSRLVYHAVLSFRLPSAPGPVGVLRQPVDVKIPSKAIESLVEVASDPVFMSLGERDVFPHFVIMDGLDILIDIRSSAGRFRMEKSTFMLTEEDGNIETDSRLYQTGIDIIRGAIDIALENR